MRWAVITGREKYEVSDRGDIRVIKTGKLRKTFMQSGYRRVSLRDESNRLKTFHVHKLVAEAFIGSVPKGMVVDHIDGDRTNNHTSNLRIVSYGVNNLNLDRSGLRKIKAIIKLHEQGMTPEAILQAIK